MKPQAPFLREADVDRWLSILSLGRFCLAAPAHLGHPGRELADRVTAMRPKIRILFMSGYPDEAVLQHNVLESDVHYLQKPLTPDTLTRKVRDVLRGPLRP